MRITDVEPPLIDRYLFVRVHTDSGILGLGESGRERWPLAGTATAVVDQ